MDQIKGSHRVIVICQNRGGQAGCPQQQENRENRFAAKPPEQAEQQRHEHVELFLDGKAPGVDQRVFQSGWVEIVDQLEKPDVRDKQQGRKGSAAEIAVFIGHHGEPAHHDRHQNYGEQCRKDAPRAAGIEITVTEAACFALAGNDAADQKPRDHKEYIHTGISRADHGQPKVTQDNPHHRDGAQSVNFLPVCHMPVLVLCLYFEGLCTNRCSERNG